MIITKTIDEGKYLTTITIETKTVEAHSALEMYKEDIKDRLDYLAFIIREGMLAHKKKYHMN